MMKILIAILFLPCLLYAGTCRLVDTKGNGIHVRLHSYNISMKDCLDTWWILKPSQVKRSFMMKEEVIVFEGTADKVEIMFEENSDQHDLVINGVRKY